MQLAQYLWVGTAHLKELLSFFTIWNYHLQVTLCAYSVWPLEVSLPGSGLDLLAHIEVRGVSDAHSLGRHRRGRVGTARRGSSDLRWGGEFRSPHTIITCTLVVYG